MENLRPLVVVLFVGRLEPVMAEATMITCCVHTTKFGTRNFLGRRPMAENGAHRSRHADC